MREFSRTFTAIGLLLCSTTIAQTSLNAHFRPANPDDPSSYLLVINTNFSDFFHSFHYYPPSWDDIYFNCREYSSDPRCKALKLHSQPANRVLTFPSGQYKYIISRSSRESYRVVAVRNNGCQKYYIDHRGLVENVKPKGDQISICASHQ